MCLSLLLTAGALASCAKPGAAPGPESRPELPLSRSDELVQPILAYPGEPARVVRVDVSTHGLWEDVRPLLDSVARAGGYRLIYPAIFDRKVNIELRDVSVSTALYELLRSAELTTTGQQEVAVAPDVVFYQLPINVDSVSAETIVRRFGVSRAMADVIVRARPPL